jgi:hypothetical protein
MNAIANLFRKPATSDELYQMITRVLIVFRQTASVKTPTGFRDCLSNLQTYVDIRCEEDKKRLDRSQRAYVQAVRDLCLSKIDEVRDIVDRLVPALAVPDVAVARQLYGELDGVFRPPDNGDSWDVFTRAAASSD